MGKEKKGRRQGIRDGNEGRYTRKGKAVWKLRKKREREKGYPYRNV